MISQKLTKLLILSLLPVIFLTSCAAVPPARQLGSLPPILAMDELLRPYEKLGKIQIVRKVQFADYDIQQDPNLHEWANSSLQAEAAKLGADAVILPEITSRQINIAIFPSFPATEYRASGVAIKFK